MRKKKKWSGKRYCVFAKRQNENDWSDWIQTDDLKTAKEKIEKVRELGFLGQITDRKKQKIIMSD